MSDRNWRYRSHAVAPPGEKRCAFCGSTEDVQLGHVNGDEHDINPRNLLWQCRSCNGLCAHTLKRAGLGRRTAQYNPPSGGAKSLAGWLTAVMVMRGESNQMALEDAIRTIHDTPPARRSEFGRQVWDLRKQRGTDRWASEVPF